MAKRNPVKFLRVTNAQGLRVVKEGDVYQYRINEPGAPSIADYFPENGRGTITDEKIIDDLNNVLNHATPSMCETSLKNDFVYPYMSKKEREVLRKQMSEAEKKREAERQPVETGSTTSGATAAPQAKRTTYQGTQIASKTKQATHTPESADKPRVQKSRAQEVKKQLLSTDYNGFSEKEINTLYALAYKNVYGNTDNLKKDLKTKDIGEKIELIDEYVDYALATRRVADDEIPPMNILEKLPIIKTNRALMFHYKRKLNRMPKTVSILGRFGPLQFNTDMMPTSLRVATNISKLAVRGGGAVIGALRSLGAAKNTTEAEKTPSITASQHARDISQTQTTQQTAQATAPAVQSSQAAPAAVPPMSENSPFWKILSSMDKHLMRIERFMAPKEDTTVKAAESVVGEDKVSTKVKDLPKAPQNESKPGSKAEAQSGGGILSKLMSSLSFLLTPLKLLGSGFMSLLGVIGKFGGSLLSLVGRLGSSALSGIGKAVTSIGSRAALGIAGGAAAVAGAGYLGYKAGEALNEHFGLSDKISDAMVSATANNVPNPVVTKEKQQLEVRYKKKMADAGVPTAVIDKWKIGDALPQEYVKVKEQERANALQASTKTKSDKLTNTEVMKEAATENKQASIQKQMIDASSRNATTIVQSSGGGNRLLPRTSDSTFRNFLNSRVAFV